MDEVQNKNRRNYSLLKIERKQQKKKPIGFIHFEFPVHSLESLVNQIIEINDLEMDGKREGEINRGRNCDCHI